MKEINPDFALESWKQRNFAHHIGERSEERRSGNNLELRNTRKGSEESDLCKSLLF